MSVTDLSFCGVRSRALAFLDSVEAAGEPAGAVLLYPYWKDRDWLVRARALVVWGRVASLSEEERVLAWLARQKDVVWQLQALDAWWQLPLNKTARLAALKKLWDRSENPLMVRALSWSLANVGGKDAAEALAGCIFSPHGRLLADDWLYRLWLLVTADLREEDLQAIIAGHEKLGWWLKFRIPPKKLAGHPFIGLYPGADYLWREAKAAGVSKKDYKRLFYRARV